jgi:hypothetical protein
MKIAMYKGPPKKLVHKISHYAITLWTGQPYSHAELIPYDDVDVNGYPLCMSSSARDGGVRIKGIDINSGHWDIYHLPLITDAQRTYAATWFLERTNIAKYDYFALLWFIIPIRLENRKRWFCFESIAAALQLPNPHKFHAGNLLDYIRRPL